MATKIVDVSAQAKAVGLPATQKVVHLEYTDPETGRVQSGDFTIKRMSLGDTRKAAITKARLCGGIPSDVIDPEIAMLNNALATLEHAVVEAPNWWKPEEMYSGGVIFDLYKEVLKHEATFRPSLREESSSTEGDGPIEIERVDGAPDAVVGSQVPASAHK